VRQARRFPCPTSGAVTHPCRRQAEGRAQARRRIASGVRS
jgi:hypothetical protein